MLIIDETDGVQCQAKIDPMNVGGCSIYEPGLTEMMNRNAHGVA